MDNEGTAPEFLFDTPSVRVLRALAAPAASIVEAFLAEDLIPAKDLRARIPAYLQELEQARSAHEFLDIQLANKLGEQCLGLLDGIDIDTPEETRRLIQAAIRYFLLDDDADSDKESLIGFDDDARVLELVAREIGRDDVLG